MLVRAGSGFLPRGRSALVTRCRGYLTSLPLSPLLWASFQLFYKGFSKKAGIRQSFLQFTALEIIILT